MNLRAAAGCREPLSHLEGHLPNGPVRLERNSDQVSDGLASRERLSPQYQRPALGGLCRVNGGDAIRRGRSRSHSFQRALLDGVGERYRRFAASRPRLISGLW
jgi:hypothetical protein